MADEATTRSSRPAGAQGWRATLDDPTVRAVGFYSLFALLAALTAYFVIFTRFAPYDDEGTVLVTLKAFAQGDVLYRDVYSIYGPFYYELFGGFFAFTGIDVTTEASRTIVIFVWVGASLLFGIAAHRLTGMLSLGLVAMGTAFAALFALANEPMHPQGLCVLLLGAFLVIASREPARSPLWAGAACGSLLGALVLTKVNLGIFAIAAVVLAAAWTFGPFERLRPLRVLVVAGFLALPLLVTARDLDIGWTRELMLLEVLAISALLVAAAPLRRGRETPAGVLSSWLLGAAAAFAVAVPAILAVILLTGPSPADLYDGAIVQGLRVRDVLVSQFPFPPAALDWAIAAVVAALLLTRLGSGGERGPSPWPGTLRTAAGLTILCNVAGIVPFGLNPDVQNPIVVPMLLAWVVALPPGGGSRPPYERFLRVLLPGLAIAETLQVYPVAGSQVSIASVAFVPVGALCLGDGVVSLRGWARARGREAATRLGVAVPVVAVALVGLFALDTMLRPAATGAVAYRDQKPLPFAGAEALHLPAAEVETYVGLADLLRRYRCTTFVAYPNLNSLYLWTGIEPPPPAAPGAWIKALDSETQQRVVDEMRATSRPCAIRNQARAEEWLGGEPPPERPLVRYLRDDFAPVAEVGGFEFALPKERAG